MKELLIEEKAKAYDEIIKKANKMHHENCEACQACIEELIPELKESEDERIRNFLIDFIKVCGWTEKKDQGWPLREECIAWLEKQRSKDNVEDVDILHRFSFYSYKDEPNVLYLSGLYVNEECRNKGIGTKILEVADEVAKSLNCHAIRLKTKKDSNAERLYRTHGYNSLAIEERDEIWLEKQVEQKSAEWSEENKSYLLDFTRWFEQKAKAYDINLPMRGFDICAFCKEIIERLRICENLVWENIDETQRTNAIIMLKEGACRVYTKDSIDKCVDWLKSLRPQSQWKPSEEQMSALSKAIAFVFDSNSDVKHSLESLYNELKKL